MRTGSHLLLRTYLTVRKQEGQLVLSTRGDIIEPRPTDLDTSWIVHQRISLERFLANQVTAESIMVRPEKWNQPECDGLYMHRNESGERQLVAWNASEAHSHKGDVTKLTLFLRSIGNRDENPNSLRQGAVRVNCSYFQSRIISTSKRPSYFHGRTSTDGFAIYWLWKDGGDSHSLMKVERVGFWHDHCLCRTAPMNMKSWTRRRQGFEKICVSLKT